MKWFAVLCAAAVAGACAAPVASIGRLAAPPCASAGVSLIWYGPSRDRDRLHLSRGCEAVSSP
ncbi:MAG TPA: hypothetical protein VIW45_06330, partial [Vicinamibacterales bacterium]